jgi:hypothetical protein
VWLGDHNVKYIVQAMTATPSGWNGTMLLIPTERRSFSAEAEARAWAKAKGWTLQPICGNCGALSHTDIAEGRPHGGGNTVCPHAY